VSTTAWQPEGKEKALRRRPLRVLARPWTEREFVHAEYERLLEALADRDRFRVVALRDFAGAPRDRVLVGLRHDVEERIASALQVAELEHRHGLPATYFILHTARYYGRVGWRRAGHRESLLPKLQRLQQLGHEVGWHNDLVTLQCVHDVEPREYLQRELAWLRGHGIDVRGSASHGSYWTERLGYHNNYFFEDLKDAEEGYPNDVAVVQAGARTCELSKGRLDEFGLEYEAYHLDEGRYFSDGRFDAAGRRWHPAELDLDQLEPGDSMIVLTHPDYWDPSVPSKAVRTVVWSARRMLTGERRHRLR
jgi:hypothetical protein